MGNFLRQLFKRLTTSKSKPNPFLRPPQLIFLEERITPSNSPIIVTTTSDAVGHSGISLRDAINTANNTAGDDIINFSITGTITLDSVLKSLPTIINATTPINGGGTAGTVTIIGPGSSSLIISGLDGGNNNRDFNIFNIDTGGNLTISGVTVSGAKSSGNGGAFNNSGTLTVTNSTISGNSSALNGGGIDNRGTLNLTNTTLSSNSAVFAGGGIFNLFGIGTITNSTFSSNSTGTAGGGAVTITTTGKGEVKKVQIDPKLLDPSEAEMLEDLITAAFNNAKQNCDRHSDTEINKMGISPSLLKGMM